MSAKETKEKILKCTTELILERGGDISNVTIRTIAARAGIGVGLTNHYFESKEQLIEECIENVFAELFDLLINDGKHPGEDASGTADTLTDSRLQPAGKTGPDRDLSGLEPDDELLSGLLNSNTDPLDPELDNELLSGLYAMDESDGSPEEKNSQTVNSFELADEGGSDETTRKTAGLVLDFLIRNEAIAKAALVRDAQNPLRTDYTARLTDAFAYAMVDKKKLDEIVSNDRMTDHMKEQFREHIINDQKLKAFMIMSSIKEALIRREVLKTSMEIDLQDDEQRNRYVDSLMELLY